MLTNAETIVGAGIHAQDDKFYFDSNLLKLTDKLSGSEPKYELSWMQFQSSNKTLITPSRASCMTFASWILRATLESKQRVDARVELYNQDNKVIGGISNVNIQQGNNNSIDFWAVFPVDIVKNVSLYKLVLETASKSGSCSILQNEWKFLDFQWIVNPIRRRPLNLKLDTRRSCLVDLMDKIYLIGSKKENENWTRRLCNLGVSFDQVINIETTLLETALAKSKAIEALYKSSSNNSLKIGWIFTDFAEPNGNFTWTTWENEFWALICANVITLDTVVCWAGKYLDTGNPDHVPLPTSPRHPIHLSTLAGILSVGLLAKFCASKSLFSQWLNHVSSVRPNVDLVEYSCDGCLM